MTHTPGPWKCKGNKDGTPTLRFETEAEARLRDAAPALLEALIDMVNLQWEPEHRDVRAIWEKANAAIAKAKGE